MTAGAGTVLLSLESDREVLPAIYIPDDYGLLLPIARGFSPLDDEIWGQPFIGLYLVTIG